MKHMDANERYPRLSRHTLEAIETQARKLQWTVQRENDEDYSVRECDAMLGFFIGKVLLNGVNGGNADAIADGFLLAFQTDHNTLQQSAFRTLLHFIRSYAETPDLYTDARNGASVRVARKIAEATRNSGLPLV